jgi:hypothetical protein
MESAIEIIQSLYTKYADDKYMCDKVNAYIRTMPAMMEKYKQSKLQRQARNETAANDQEHFARQFLDQHKYFYCSSSNKFFFYDGYHYETRSEDDVLHHILRTITEFGNTNLMSYKQRTKIYVRRRIRETPLLQSVPNDDTIEYVLDRFCTAFTTRSEIKYFLTILGDCILGKQTHLVHMISPEVKSFVQEMNNYCQLLVGLVCSTTFKYKYHEQYEYANMRILHMNAAMKMEALWPQIFAHFADVVCVAAHFSTRYESSDGYLEHVPSLRQTVMCLRDSDADQIVGDFVKAYISQSESAGVLPWKNMIFLWKHYLEAKQLPAIMFQATFQAKMRQQSFYDADVDGFVGVTSDKLPAVRKFLDFWDQADSTEDYDVEELVRMYKKWSGQDVTENQLLGMLRHFYPDLEIEENRYVSTSPKISE